MVFFTKCKIYEGVKWDGEKIVLTIVHLLVLLLLTCFSILIFVFFFVVV